MSFLTVDEFGQLDPEDLGLKLRSFSGYEEMSRLFVFHLEMDVLDEKSDQLTADALMGKRLVFSVREPQRYFSGIISRLSLGQVDGKGRRECRAEVVPELWTLTEILDSRKFKSQTVVELLRLVLDETRLDIELLDRTRSRPDLHPPRVNPTQFDETTMNFLGRLMDEEAIYYFFRNEIEEGKGRSQLVLGDQSRDYDDTQVQLKYQPTANVRDANSVTTWARQLQYRPSHWNLHDYDHRQARDMNRTLAGGDGPLHKFKRTARFYDKEYGRHRLDKFMEHESVSREYVEAESQCQRLYPGLRFTLEDHPSSGENGSYVVAAVEHYAIELDGQGEAGHEYENRFVCVPAQRKVVECPTNTPVRSGAVSFTPRHQRRSTVGAAAAPAGYETAQFPTSAPAAGATTIADLAVVVNRDGNIDTSGQTEIETVDGVDFVFIKYQWQIKADWSNDGWVAENHRVRVAQLMAGAGWGAKFMPRVGDEVIVLFADGDPDSMHNVIIGVLNNSVNKFPDKESVGRDTMQTVKLIEEDAFATDGEQTISAGYRHQIGDTTETEAREVPDLSIHDVSGIRTRTNKPDPDDATEHNSLLFDDKAGHERFYMHAARDMNIQVENDLYIEIKGDKREVIRGNYYQVVCVGNVPPENEDDYPKRSHDERANDGGGDGEANTGVFLGVADGVSFDYDKTYEVKTVEWNGSDGRWKEKTENLYDVELRHTGDIKETQIGDDEDWHYGDATERQYGNMDEYRQGDVHSYNDGISTSIVSSLDISVCYFFGFSTVPISLDVNALAGNIAGWAYNMYGRSTERGYFKFESVHNGVFDHKVAIENIKTRLAKVDVELGSCNARVDNNKLRLNKHAFSMTNAGLKVFL